MVRICVLSTSPREKSSSRAGAYYVQELLLQREGVEVDLIDLFETPVALYPGNGDDPERNSLVERFQRADGWVIAGAVYNGGPSAHVINFFHYSLDPDRCPPGRPFFLVSAAGGGGSAFAFDELGARVRREVKAVEVGTPAMIVGSVEDAKSRLQTHLDLFIPYAGLYASLNV